MASLWVFKPYSCAGQSEIDILVLCILLTVDLKPLHKTLSNHCMDQKQKDAPITETDTPSLNPQVIAPMRRCKVVLEDISIHIVAGKHNRLKQCQGNSQMTPSCDTVEKKSLQHLTNIM